MDDGPTIGVMAPLLTGHYFGGILAGAARSVASAGGRIIGIQSVDPGQTKIDYFSTSDFRHPVAWQHVSAFVIVLNAANRSYLQALHDAGKPVVMISQGCEGFPCTVLLPGNAAGIRAAVEHLIEHGHERIAFAGWVAQDDSRERYQAYHETLTDHGIAPDPRLLFDAGDNFETGGEQAGRQMVEAGMPSTAVVTATDFNAIGLMRVLTSAGYRLPEDQAVVSFDNINSAATLAVNLSTVDPRFDMLGEAAVELSLRQLAGERLPPERHHLPATFVRRRSCGCEPVHLTDESIPAGLIDDNQYLMSTLRSQYLVSMDLLHSHDENPQALGWLQRTAASSGCLGLWAPRSEDEIADPLLEIVGTFEREPQQPPIPKDIRPVSAFPPAAMLVRADIAGGELCHVVPVKMLSNDWGMLAYNGPVDRQKSSVTETVSQWAALLRVALDHQHMLESLRAQEEQLRRQALYDGLTGLPNRTLFMERIRAAIRSAHRHTDRQFAVLFLDLDGFKVVNDSLGHLAGDHLLTHIAERINADLREVDTAARFGGDEFAILIDGITDLPSLITIAQRLQTVIAKPVTVAGQEVVVTASIGIASSSGYHHADDLVRDADTAMYRAKATVKGSHAVFDVRMHTEAVAQLRGLDG